MQIVPLKALPNQELSVLLDNNQWDISLRDCNGVITCTLSKNSVMIVENAHAVAGMRILQCHYQEDGNFAIISNDQTVPDYNQFGVTQFLVYISPAELLISRAPPADVVDAAYFDPLGGLPLRFAPQGYVVTQVLRASSAIFAPQASIIARGTGIKKSVGTFSPHATLAAHG